MFNLQAALQHVEQHPDIPWPRGGFTWTEPLRATLPAVRGIHVPPMRPRTWRPDELLRAFPTSSFEYWDERFWMNHPGVPGAGSARRWTQEEATARLLAQPLETPDHDNWLAWSAQVVVHPSAMDWLMHHGLQWHGPVFMLRVLLDLAGLASGLLLPAKFYNGEAGALDQHLQSALRQLRRTIAAADDATYEAAHSLAASSANHAAVASARACAFPHVAEWATRTDLLGNWVLDCVQPLDLHIQRYGAHGHLPAALLQIHLHGEAAAGLLGGQQPFNPGSPWPAEQLEALRRMRAPVMIEVLVQHVAHAPVQAALASLAAEYPVATLLVTVPAVLRAGSRALEAWCVGIAAAHPDASADVLARLQGSDKVRWLALTSPRPADTELPTHAPLVLRSPPWLVKKRRKPWPVIELAALPLPDRLCWTAAERAKHLDFMPPKKSPHYRLMPGYPYPRPLIDLIPFDDESLAVLRDPPADGASVPLKLKPHTSWGTHIAPDCLLLEPDAALALRLWNDYPLERWDLAFPDRFNGKSGFGTPRPTNALLARFGEAAFATFARLVDERSPEYLAFCLPCESLRFAPAAIRSLRGKRGRVAGTAWLRAQPRAAVIAAMPMAFGHDTKDAADGRAALRWLAADGSEAIVRGVAAEYGGEVSSVVDRLLQSDPLHELPGRMPAPPHFFHPHLLPRPQLREGGELNLAAMDHLATMLALSPLDAPYAGLAIVAEACTPESLHAFAWAIVDAWAANGFPAKENWPLNAIGHFGNDADASRLGPLMLAWAQDGGAPRATVAIDVLGAIGSDVALMQLSAASTRVKSKALADRARRKLELIAAERGLTSEELADRIVPDLGLDSRGTLVLDHGPRHFTVAFDETLTPHVLDPDGARFAKLPKPLKTDDAVLAAAAAERLKQLRVDAKGVATVQLRRLETAMVERREWTLAAFREFVVAHPLLRHLASRLVWATYDGDRLGMAFRIAEDGSFADAGDARCEPGADASIRVAYYRDVPAEVFAAFGTVFHDYEILQPFRQLNRDRDYEARRAEHARGGW